MQKNVVLPAVKQDIIDVVDNDSYACFSDTVHFKNETMSKSYILS